MKKTLALGSFALLLVAGSTIRGQHSADNTAASDHAIVRPEAIKWGPPPPGLPAGATVGVLSGDPGTPGSQFVLRAKMPDGYKVPPHWHSIDENLTILQGTLLAGHGDKLDPAAAEPLGPGSFVHMPKGMHHFVIAKGETIIQVHGVGPFDITYINPSDDPRKKDLNK